MDLINQLGLFRLLLQKYIGCNKHTIFKTDTLTPVTLNLGVSWLEMFFGGVGGRGISVGL